MKINGVDYGNKELDFTNILCDLEDIDIDIMSMNSVKTKPFSLCRGIVSVYTGEKDLQKCGKILSEHLKSGGSLDEILKPFTEAMEASGFGSAAKKEKTPQTTEVPEKSKDKAEKVAE